MSEVPTAEEKMEKVPSRLTLGTAQLGLNYGIANRVGKPSYDAAREIVATALREGISSFDTAAAYGESEKVLGRALSDLEATDRVFLSSKVHLGEFDGPRKAVEEFIDRTVRRSCSLLGVERLDVCLMHRAQDVEFVPALARLCKEDLVVRAGISVMTPDEACRALDMFNWLADSSTGAPLRAIQLPTSVLDQRFLREGILCELKDAGVLVFARSVFLQGLIVMADEDVPDALREVISTLRELRSLAREYEMSVAEMAIRFVLTVPEVDSVVIGAELPSQVEENTAIAHRGPLPFDLFERITTVVPDLPDEILMPNLWPWNRK